MTEDLQGEIEIEIETDGQTDRLEDTETDR
jgi:hypothetical protein